MESHAGIHPHRSERRLPTHAWWLILCVVGLDYFSSLAYLPSLAVEAAGFMAPLAILGVVGVTLFVALPLYIVIVGKSPHGQGATGLLERHLHGWSGKLLVLVLLGFVATDFIMTRTVSLADAAVHLTQNSHWHAQVDQVAGQRENLHAHLPHWLHGPLVDYWDEQLVIAVVLSILTFGLYFFLVRGFSRGFVLAAAGVVLVYLSLTGLVVGAALADLVRRPEQVSVWLDELREIPRDVMPAAEVLGLVLLSIYYFPQVALGISGFELSMASAPLVRGLPGDQDEHPRGRIRNVRKLLVAAALIMSLFLFASVLAVTALVPPEELEPGGAARQRALSYLAHGGRLFNHPEATPLHPWLGPTFGSLYDLSTILILCLAGASITISLREVVPHYLARYGMQLQWASRINVILHLFNVFILLVTVVFRASVEAQQWAYASSVLVLLLSAALAVLLEIHQRWRGSAWRLVAQLPLLFVALFFLLMTLLTLWHNPSGLAIALVVVLIVLATGLLSRYLRSTELRFKGFRFADEATERRWEEIRQMEFQVLVPHRRDHLALVQKEQEIRSRHRLGPDVAILYVEAELGDPSDFYQQPIMHIVQEDGREIIRVSHCSSIAHVLAALALELRTVGRPPELHFAWSNESPVSANLGFLLLGEGNIPWMVHALLQKAEPDPLRQPRVVIG